MMNKIEKRTLMEKTDTLWKRRTQSIRNQFFFKKAHTVLDNFINTDCIFILNGCRTSLNQLQTKLTIALIM